MEKQKIRKVAIQGVYGSFHEIAAREYYCNEEIELILCNTFNDLATAIMEKHADTGVMAIENSVAGSLLPNYALVRETGLIITGEYLFVSVKIYLHYPVKPLMTFTRFIRTRWLFNNAKVFSCDTRISNLLNLLTQP